MTALAAILVASPLALLAARRWRTAVRRRRAYAAFAARRRDLGTPSAWIPL